MHGIQLRINPLKATPIIPKELQSLSLPELRQRWAEAWGVEPHARIGRAMLEVSLAYKQRELAGHGLTEGQQARLAQLIKQYRRNPKCFEVNQPEIKPGTRLVRMWNGRRCSVLVQAGGYEYEGRQYRSLSQVASEIAGTRWNGWSFFGLKRKVA